MAILRFGTSTILGFVVTFALIVVMFKLIDSGNTEIDSKQAIKIADFLHVERETVLCDLVVLCQADW